MLSEAEFKVLRALAAGVPTTPTTPSAATAQAAAASDSPVQSPASAAPTTQRQIAEVTGLSLGSVNGHLQTLAERGWVQSAGNPSITADGLEVLLPYKVDNAIILAAGFGSRFVPYTYEVPKGLLKVNGTPMVERQIEQLLAVGVNDITLVVGYKKEMFDYLIDKYQERLVCNPEYAVKNNFVSLYCAREVLGNSYVLVSDDWIEQNIFHRYEYDSWICGVYYPGQTAEWVATTAAHDRITHLTIGGTDAWGLIGPAYFSRDYSRQYRVQLEEYYARPGTEDFYFEQIIRDNLKTLAIRLNRQSAENVHEFENMKELRQYDQSYQDEAKNEVMEKIAEVFQTKHTEVDIIGPLKEGMTNKSFLFAVDGVAYVFRLPGEGTDKLIDRAGEKRAYELIEPLGLADEIIYFDGASGVKISRYYEGARVADPEDDAQVAEVMQLLRKIHAAKLEVSPQTGERRFDVCREIDFYEQLARELDAIQYQDYAEVRAKADELLALRERLEIPEVLCHIDYVYTNVLYLPEGMRVIDWEYAGFADPIIDVAMFAIYAYYNRQQADRALFHYLGRQPTRAEETRLYLYMALCGLLWSLWTEYKQGLGDEFGDYSLTQYRYMKDFYRILHDEGYLQEAANAAATDQ